MPTKKDAPTEKKTPTPRPLSSRGRARVPSPRDATSGRATLSRFNGSQRKQRASRLPVPVSPQVASAERYKLASRRIRDLIDLQQREDRDLLDLTPELLLLRAILIDYVSTTSPTAEHFLSESRALIKEVGSLVEKINRVSSSGSISLATFRRACEQMGLSVARYVKDDTALRAIEQDWNSISLDAREDKHRLLPAHVAEAEFSENKDEDEDEDEN